MKKLTLKQQATADYLKGCDVMGVEPENYKRWTVQNLHAATDELRSAWARQKRDATIDSVKKNTTAAVNTITQAVGEPLRSARDRAIALAKQTGRAIPFTFTISRK